MLIIINHDGGPKEYEETLRSLGGDDRVRVIEISEQPRWDRKTASLKLAFRGISARAQFGHSIQLHKNPLLLAFAWRVLFPAQEFWRLVTQTERFLRSRWVEEILLEKHRTAWFQLIQSKFEVALVLEADALLRDGMSELLQDLANFIRGGDAIPMIVFLADGFGEKELGTTFVKQVPSFFSSSEIFESQPPTANTACAYMLNRDTARLLHSSTQNLSVHAADWELTRQCRNLGVQALHVLPPPFAHGSRERGVSSVR